MPDDGAAEQDAQSGTARGAVEQGTQDPGEFGGAGGELGELVEHQQHRPVRCEDDEVLQRVVPVVVGTRDQIPHGMVEDVGDLTGKLRRLACGRSTHTGVIDDRRVEGICEPLQEGRLPHSSPPPDDGGLVRGAPPAVERDEFVDAIDERCY